MLIRIPTIIIFVAAIALSSSPLVAGGKKKKVRYIPPHLDEARAAIKKYLNDKGELLPPEVKWYEDDNVRRAFHAHIFFVVRYPQYPRPQVPAKGLKYANLFAVGFGEENQPQLQLITTPNQLRTFFKQNYRSHSGKVTPEEANDVMLAWLKFSQELVQDGYYRFKNTINQVDYQGARVPQVPTIISQSLVTAGGKGLIQATIDFNFRARIERVIETHKIRPGDRPGR